MMKCANIKCDNELTDYETTRQTMLTVRYYICRMCRQMLGQGSDLRLKCVSCNNLLDVLQRKIPPQCKPCVKHKTSEYIKKYKRDRYIPRKRKLKTHCLRGHEFAVTGKYRRSCRQCILERSRGNYNPRPRKTHCIHGHEFAVTGKYRHRCAECARIYFRTKHKNIRSVLI